VNRRAYCAEIRSRLPCYRETHDFDGPALGGMLLTFDATIVFNARSICSSGLCLSSDPGCSTSWRSRVSQILHERDMEFRYLIRDRDSKFSKSFDQVFESESCEIVLTPRQAPDSNSYSERWVRTARNECLDHILTFNGVNARFANRPIMCRYCGNSRPTTMKGDLTRDLSNTLR
jgi:hypothetical protein